MWSLGRRIGFRFGTLMMLLLVWPLAIGILATLVGSERLFLTFIEPWHWLIARFADHVLGIELGPRVMTGSGDTLWHYVELLFITVLAVLGTAAWSIADRRCRAYTRLAATLTVALRYYLAFILIGYGMAKVLPMQFPPLWLGRYDQAIGDMSPMGLLWSFMGYSQAYTFFAGFAELLGAVLLLWRRTYVIGALVLLGVMTHVVLLNFCYDVPVKLFSMQLTIMLLALLGPHARRIACALLGRPTPELPPRLRSTPAHERARAVLKLLAIAIIALRAYQTFMFTERVVQMRAKTPLHGSWSAQRVVIDDAERPPLFTDDERWRKVIFHEYGVTVRYATDRRVHYRVEIDDKHRTITLIRGVLRHVWRYERPALDRLVIETPDTRAELVLEPETLLHRRGFHWIQEAPFNR